MVNTFFISLHLLGEIFLLTLVDKNANVHTEFNKFLSLWHA